jgi:4-hydroxy-tetrahydrodipicolinate synthase
MEDNSVFSGCIPALMTPCNNKGVPDFDALVRKGKELVNKGMSAVVYCGSMGDWPLLTDEERTLGVEALCSANIPVIVGTGAQNTQRAATIAAHAQSVGAAGLMIIPRLLSRGLSAAAQYLHFTSVLQAAPDLPSVIYNSPYYGYETKADLFFKLRNENPNLIGFKEFGGAKSMTYAAENITSGSDGLILMVGVDTQVFHGFINCGAGGAITGVGNALPQETLRLIELCERAKDGDHIAYKLADELAKALHMLSSFDEGPDLVLYYKHLMVLEGHSEYQHHLNSYDQLTHAQQAFIEQVWQQFRNWWDSWSGKTG